MRPDSAITKIIEQPETNIPSTLLDDIVKTQDKTDIQTHIDTSGIVLGKVVNVESDKLFVSFTGFPDTPISAISLCALTGQDVGKICAIQFINRDINQPVIMGLVNPVSIGSLNKGEANQPKSDTTVIHQGKQVIISAEDELVLQCGECCIVMNAEGIIHMRAPYIDSQAQATHRLKGGSVQVN